MNGAGHVLEPPSYSDRRNPVFFLAKMIAVQGYRFLTSAHVEWHADVLPLRRRANTVFIYVGLHKSLWETSGLLVPLQQAGVPLPYTGMGDNLIHGGFYQSLAKSVGTFLIRRATTRQEMLGSARALHRDILGFLARGLDVLIFPEGTRKSIAKRGAYGDFFPAPFEPLLAYERDKERICAANPGLPPRDAYIVPVNVDYSFVRELHEMVGLGADKPRTLHVFDSLSMLRHVGDTYLSYGRPLPVTEVLGLGRKQLAVECRRLCMELVKILPVNVASLAMLRLPPAEAPLAPIAAATLETAVADVVAELRPYADRFRGFTSDDPPAEILRRARLRDLRFEAPVATELPFYRAYADYVRHYLPQAQTAGDARSLA